MIEVNVDVKMRMSAFYFVIPVTALIPGRSNEEKKIF
jgi:hypothetical protein